VLEAEVKREMRKRAEEAVVSAAADALREVVNTGRWKEERRKGGREGGRDVCV
jgi:hypothetical protein